MRTYSPTEHYFRITYADRARTLPNVEVFIFVGRNLSDDDVEETAYFQFVESIAEQTVKAGAPPKRMRSVTSANEKEIVDLSELYVQLKEAASRLYSAAGQPS